MGSVPKVLKAAVRRAANRVGYDFVGYDGNNARTRLARLLTSHNITLILDIGANCGQFAWDMRELGYRGRIVSFEPMRDAFSALQKAASGDPAWRVVQLGLGDRDEERVIHVAANSQSSSLLPMLEAHIQSAPESRYQKDEMVTIRRLDEILDDYRAPDDHIFLKIDTQGFERNVIEGARGMLDAAPLVQLECSLVALYEGTDLIEQTIGYVRGLGYDPVDLLPTFHHRENGQLMQVDVLFLKRGG